MCASRTFRVPLLALLLLTTPCFAQKENNIWYFGYGAGLDFNTSPPTPLTDGEIMTNEGSATVCDGTTGALLFYTDGITVWNRNHVPMRNGTGLAGSPSSTQSAMIVRSPCDTAIYYIFTSGDVETGGYMADGNNYSEIDMRLDGGNGDVVRKNIRLLLPGTEKLTAVPHENGHDVWAVMHEAGSNRFHAFLVSAEGVSSNAVVSSVGPALNSHRLGVVGALRASPDGRMLAMATENPSAEVQVFTFDRGAGRLYDHLQLDLPDPAYGICFSPGSSILYATIETTGTFQFDLLAGTPAQIDASRALIDNRGATGDLELGPDGRIYVATVADQLDAILVPDRAGAACTYRRNVIPMGKAVVRYGIQNRPTVAPSAHDMLHVRSDTTICPGGAGAMLWAGEAVTNTTWSPSEGLSCTDCPNPTAAPAATTTYVVQGSVGGCEVRKSVTVIVAPDVRALVGPDAVICRGDSAGIGRDERYPEGTILSWEPTEGLDCADCPNPWAKPAATTRYSLIVRNTAGCRDTASVLVSVNTAISAEAGPDGTICLGGETMLNGSGGDLYLWSPAEGLSCTDCPRPTASPTKSTTYRLRVTRGEQCSGFDTVTVTVLGRPRAAIEGPTEIFFCGAEGTRLRASGGTSYEWSPATGLSCADCPDPTATPSTATRYTVTVSNSEGCVDSASVTVSPLPRPVVDAGENVSICAEGSVVLRASGAVTYRWEPSTGLSCADCPDPTASPGTTTTYIVKGTNAAGCEGIDSVKVEVDPRSAVGAARIDRKYRVTPGSEVRVPITLEEGVDDAKIDRIAVGLTYRPDVVRLKDLSTAGGPLEGWTIVKIDDDRRTGSYRIELTAPAGTTLRGTGTLLTGTFTGFVGAADSAEIGLTIDIMQRAPCSGIATFPGLIRIDSLCGLVYRLIEMSTENFALLPNHPNPFNPTTDIPFSVGLSGPVTLEIHDASGRRTATVVNEVLQPGEYIATWDASDLPSGIYYARLTCGTWSRSRAMVLVR